MSGGHFNYDQYKINNIADEIEHLIFTNDSNEENDWGGVKGNHYSKETIDEFKKGLKVLKEASVYAQRIDWLVSCDDSQESFHKRLKIELDKLENE